VLEGVITQFPYLTLPQMLWLILSTLQVAQDQSKGCVKLTGRTALRAENVSYCEHYKNKFHC